MVEELLLEPKKPGGLRNIRGRSKNIKGRSKNIREYHRQVKEYQRISQAGLPWQAPRPTTSTLRPFHEPGREFE